MIDVGELGMVHLLQGSVTVPKDQVPRPGWRSEPSESPVGGMTALAIHMVDTYRYFAGPIERVSVMSKQLWGASRLDDITVVALEFARGPLGYIGTSIVLPRTHTIAVFGTSRIAWSDDDGEHLYVQDKDVADRRLVETESLDTVADELAEFGRCIREGGGRPETGAPEALHAVGSSKPSWKATASTASRSACATSPAEAAARPQLWSSRWRDCSSVLSVRSR